MNIIESYEAEAKDSTREGALRPGDHTKLGHLKFWAEETCMQRLQSVDQVAREDGLKFADLAIKQDQRPVDE